MTTEGSSAAQPSRNTKSSKMLQKIITVLILLIVTVLVGYGIWRILFGRHLEEIRAMKAKKEDTGTSVQNDINTIMGYEFVTVKTVPKSDLEPADMPESETDRIFGEESKNNGFNQVSTSEDQFHNPEEDEDPSEYSDIDELDIAEAAAGFTDMPDYDEDAEDKYFSKYEDDTDPDTIPDAPEETSDDSTEDGESNDDAFKEIMDMTLNYDGTEDSQIVDQILSQTEQP